ncbi:MAG: radical SAM protein [Bacteroidales bacterium]|nr:radical SAM protein [Bacteroidales bacterium]
MYDSYNRRINYLRISVTDKCNFRCTYCMPEEGVPYIPHNKILRIEEIVDFVKTAALFGINKVRITGGEPLVRKGIVSLVKMLHEINGIDDLSMTTNGFLLEEFAQPLVDSGLNRINISLDTLDKDKFRQITRLGDLDKVLKGIVAAKKAGLNPIKLNVVIKNNSKEPDAQSVAAFAQENGLEVRYIHMMNLATGSFSQVEGGEGGHCSSCNRLRLTADGYLMPCLFSNQKYDIRELGYEQALLKAIKEKPKSGKINNTRGFYNVGG